MPGEQAVTAFRSSSAYQAFTGRWKLSFYFTLCFQVAACNTITASLQGAFTPPASGDPLSSLSAVIWLPVPQCLCWD